jgi:hypothetical protein
MGDDYLNNYFVPGYYNTSRLYTPEQFAKVLIVQYYKQLKVQIYWDGGWLDLITGNHCMCLFNGAGTIYLLGKKKS